MPDEVQIAAPIATSVSAESPAPAVVSPVSEATAAPVVVASEVPSSVADESTALLAAEPKVEASDKPIDAAVPAAEGEKKPDEKSEEKKSEEIKKDDKPAEDAAPVVYEPFKLPDAYKDNTDAAETVTKFSEILGKLEGSKREHDDFQKFGQEATDFYINGVNGALEKQQEFYATLHQKNITDRLDAVRKDPQLGGKNFDKTSADMIEAVQAYGGNKEQVMQLRKDMQESGMGVSPSLVRFVANMKSALDKYTKEPVSSNITGTKPDIQKRGAIATLYGS